MVNNKLLEELKEQQAERLCGTCGFPKDLNQFYKDGKDKEGNTKYRRDCKECYNKTRVIERRNKLKTTQKPLTIGTQTRRRARK
jgi:hypothetical protein